MTRWLLFTPAMLMALYGPPAAAQMQCGDRGSIVRQLEGEYLETRRGFGQSSLIAIIEVWASSVTGTWTILKTYSNGLACIAGSGIDWQDESPKRGKPT